MDLYIQNKLYVGSGYYYEENLPVCRVCGCKYNASHNNMIGDFALCFDCGEEEKAEQEECLQQLHKELIETILKKTHQ